MNTKQIQSCICCFIFFEILILFNPQIVFAQEVDISEMSQMIQEMKNLQKTFKEISDDNTKIFWSSFLIGITISIIAITATLENSRRLKQQIKNQEKEIRHRIRPIISKDDFPHGETYKIIDNDDNGKQFWIKIANKGSLPAINIERKIRHTMKHEDDKPKKESLEKCNYVHKNMPSLGVGDHIYYSIILTEEEYSEICNGVKYYFEMKIEYTEPVENEKTNPKKYFYNFTSHFQKGILYQDVIDVN